MKKYIYPISMGAIIVGWLAYSTHFYGLLGVYAKASFAGSHPLLYIAVESWGMVCLVVACFFIEKWLRNVLSLEN